MKPYIVTDMDTQQVEVHYSYWMNTEDAKKFFLLDHPEAEGHTLLAQETDEEGAVAFYAAKRRAALDAEAHKYEHIKSLSILQGSFGCASTDHAQIDPYFDAENWHDAARGDGHCYSGVLEWVAREEGESWADFWVRAEEREKYYEYNVLQCSRCHPSRDE